MKRLSLLITLIAFAFPAFGQDAGWLGVTLADQPNRGVLIRTLDANSPASRAGLQENDVIIEYNGQAVVGVLQLTRMVRETPAGRMVEVKVQRGGVEQTVQVTLGSVPTRGGTFRIQSPDFSVLRDRFSDFSQIQVTTSAAQAGIRVQSLTAQLREFFGITGNVGVLVVTVEAGSAGERGGVRAGDVISSVDGAPVSTPAEFSREIRSSGSTVTLKVVRDKQERDIRIEGIAPR